MSPAELLQSAFDQALADQREGFERYRTATTARNAAIRGSAPSRSEFQAMTEDKVAEAVAECYEVPIVDVVVDGRRYGQILADRRVGA